MKKIIILSGGREQFEIYVRVNGLKPEEVVYGRSAHDIQGIEASKVEIIGTFWDRSDASELKRLAESRIRL